MKKTKNILWFETKISRENREKLIGQRGIVLWLTGLSGSGKSTIANALEQSLADLGKLTYILDGDNIRHGINNDLGFSNEERKENIRRIGEIAKLFIDTGVITIASFISPLNENRKEIRKLLSKDYIEIFIDCPLEVCEERDPKGLYKKARDGEIKEFTGISSVYEKPINPEIIIESHKKSIKESVETIINYISPLINIGGNNET